VRPARGLRRLPAAVLGLLAVIGAIILVVTQLLPGGSSSPSSSSARARSTGPGEAVLGAASAPSEVASRSAVASPSAVASSAARSTEPANATGRAGPADPLGTAAASYLGTRSGTVLAAVYDLGTHQSWTLDAASQAQDEASVVKVDVLETLLAQQPGGLSAADQSLAQQMIEDSDNDAATALWDSVGGADGIRAFNTRAGLTSTTPSACVECPGFPWPGWGLSTTTPLDQIALLRELVTGSGSSLSSADREYALGLMENVTADQRWGVSGGVPAQTTVALKNGWLPLNTAGTDWQINSIGWVSGLGRNYLIAVLSTGNPSEAYGIDTINELSALVWNHMGA
jgi:hypothetical protein